MSCAVAVGWTIVPSLESIPGSASAGYEYTRKNPINASYMDSGGIPSNKTGVPFGLLNGLLKAIWVGCTDLTQFDIKIYWHLGNESSLTLLTTVTFSGADLTQTFGESDFGTVNIPTDVQIAVQVDNIIGTVNNLKVYLRPTGDQP